MRGSVEAQGTHVFIEQRPISSQLAFAVSLLLPLSFFTRGFIQPFGITVEKYIVGFLSICWVIGILQEREFRMFGRFQLATSAFLLWSAASVLWSVDPQRSLIEVPNLFVIAALTIILWDLYRTKKDIRLALFAYISTTGILSVSVVMNLLAGLSFGTGRYTGVGLNPNVLAVAVVFGIPLCWHLIERGSERRWVYLFLGLDMLLSAVAVFLTGSRQGLIALILTVCYIVWSLISNGGVSLRNKHTLVSFVTIVVATSTILLLAPATINRFMMSPSLVLSGSMGARLEQWTAGLSLFLNQPILGIGVNSFVTAIEPLIGRQVSPDNSYLSILYGLGVTGSILFMILMTTLIRSASRLYGSFWNVWTAFLLLWLVLSLVNDLQWERFTWLLFTYLVADAHSNSQLRIFQFTKRKIACANDSIIPNTNSRL